MAHTQNYLQTSGGWLSCGVYARDGSRVTVVGNISAPFEGIDATGKNTRVVVTGDVSVSDSDVAGVVDASDHAVVAVHGNLSTTGGHVFAGVDASGGSQVTVTGNITIKNGAGVYAADKATRVIVSGNISTNNGSAVAAWNNATVTVTGNTAAKGEGVIAVLGATGSLVTINGSVISDDIGVRAGVSVDDNYVKGAQVTVNGTITAPHFIVLEDTEGSGDDNDVVLKPSDFTTPTTKAGYRTYTDGISTVWVQHLESSSNPTSTVSTPLSLVKTGDGSNLTAALIVSTLVVLVSGMSLFVVRERNA